MIQIRKYKEKDWSRLCEIHDLARIDELKGSVDMAAFKTLEQTFENEGLFEDQLYVALDDNIIRGFIAFDKTEITWLYVDPKLYMKGIGSALLAFALKKYKSINTVEVLYKNEKAISFYKKHGFNIIEKKEGLLEGNTSFKTTGYIMQLSK